MLDRLYLLKVLSNNICILYEEASYYLSSNNYVKDKRYKEILDKIRELIIIEDKIISSISLDNLEDMYNICLKELEASDFTDAIVTRIGSRIEHQIDCLNGESAKVEEIDLEDIFPEGTVFSIHGLIDTKFSIDMLKLLNRLINSLKPSQGRDKAGDERFIVGLKKELELSKGELFTNIVPLETISMFYDNDIESLPDIDLKVFKDLTVITGDVSLEKCVEDAIKDYLDRTLGRLNDFIDRNKNIVIENNPSDVFSFLKVIARIEAIIPYLPKKKLKNYLNLLRKDSIFIGEHTINVTYVKNMIRKRLKEM